MDAFVVVTSLGSVIVVFTWSMIMVSYIAFLRRRPHLHASSTFRMPGAKFMPHVVLVFFALMIVALAQADDTRLGLYVAPIWFVLLGVAWFFNSRTPMQQARIKEWKEIAAAEKLAVSKLAVKR